MPAVALALRSDAIEKYSYPSAGNLPSYFILFCEIEASTINLFCKLRAAPSLTIDTRQVRIYPFQFAIGATMMDELFRSMSMHSSQKWQVKMTFLGLTEMMRAVVRKLRGVGDRRTREDREKQ